MLYLHYSDDLSRAEADSMQLCNPKSTHSLVQRCSIHVDGGSQRKNKTADTFVHMIVLLHAFYGGWQSGRTKELKNNSCLSNDIVTHV